MYYYTNKWSINFSELDVLPDTIKLHFTSMDVPADALIKEFDYIDSTTENQYYMYEIPVDGTYKLETWGAQGGYGGDKTKYYGGYGGYSSGNIYLNKGEVIYIVVGGQGASATAKASRKVLGGYNGGGSGFGYSDKYVSGGGGATHIAKKSGDLTLFENDLKNLLMVAGGGGGGAMYSSSNYGIGGSGGGYNGVPNNNVGNNYTSTGATQTSSGTGHYPGTFGKGGCNATGNGCSGGGGGLYGGDAAWYQGGGAGGSGYIGNSLLFNKSMYCYKCKESIEESTYTINTNGTNENLDKTNCPNGYSAEPISKCAKAGNGYARITYVNDAN